ncbi:unnamed protein product [Sphenostylis stenocarpa]|uniref:Uncharacterized protein n=1 Tax=Sphenostylis stenocarpa TaxID=92480 RepID=A0AA86V5P2_9FABA|nr:unnamed protein product [Sphenostylis stenocarpa]
MEKNQSKIIQHFVKQAFASSSANALASVLVEATSHRKLFIFSEILSLPNLQQLAETENSVYFDMLRLFAHGTWSDYRSNADRLPLLLPDQILKLKQLTVLTLAGTYKIGGTNEVFPVPPAVIGYLVLLFYLIAVIELIASGLTTTQCSPLAKRAFGSFFLAFVLPYDKLMQELDVTNVRELEDFLIDECMYLVKFAARRDLRPTQLGSMIQTLSNWLSTSENLLVSVEEKIKWVDARNEIEKKHRKDMEENLQKVKNNIRAKLWFGAIIDVSILWEAGLFCVKVPSFGAFMGGILTELDQN